MLSTINMHEYFFCLYKTNDNKLTYQYVHGNSYENRSLNEYSDFKRYNC